MAPPGPEGERVIGGGARSGRSGARSAPLPPLHVVTDDALLADPDWSAAARAVLHAGGPRLALHLRGPRTPARRLHELARGLLPAARRAGALLLVNDRVDVALCLPVDGVHLGARSLRADAVRPLLGERWIGASVHSVPEAAEAEGAGADFLVVGTIFATESHPGREPAGPALLEAVGRRSGLPLVAIGGVSPELVGEVRSAGALGVAALRGVWSAPEPPRAVEGYLHALERH